MPASAQQDRILGVIESEHDLALLRLHLKEIVEGAAFRGTNRSAQFLSHVLDQAIAGNDGALKERVIGVELFGRSPNYDTGEDAIVRVTANDVRKRLLQHYGRYGTTSEFRISLPPGHYHPEITRLSQSVEKDDKAQSVSANEVQVLPPEPKLAESIVADPESASPTAAANRRNGMLALLVATLCLVIGSVWFFTSRGKILVPGTPKISALAPWSILLDKSRSTSLITSDPNIAEIQGLTGIPITISNYANQIYFPPGMSLSPEVERIARTILRGDKAANVDVPIVARIAEIAAASNSPLGIHPARGFRLDELDVENHFIFIGSPLTNPWTSLFNEEMDFQFAYDDQTRSEYLKNIHPRLGEMGTYIPTAKGFGTGDSYATVSFVGNPNHAGGILILAGLNAEGTRAAGEFITSSETLSAALHRCQIDSSGKVNHFQVLLHLSTMAGSPRHWDMLACHLLS